MGTAQELRLFSEEIRVETLHTFAARGFGHVGGSLSIVETLAVLYGGVMRIDPKNPDWPDRDRLVLSKGHAGAALYATLALRGYFQREELSTFNQPGSRLPSHCDRNRTPGVDMTTGSLGQGISIACGMALGQKLDKNGARTYLIVGDGECDEGQVWEGALFAPHYKLDNLIAFCDKNGQQLDGYVKDVMDTGDLAAKFDAFGWFTQSVDGHDVDVLNQAVQKAINNTGRPSMIVLNTKKGRGCSFSEGKENNHHSVFSEETMSEALKIAEAVLDEARTAAAL